MSSERDPCLNHCLQCRPLLLSAPVPGRRRRHSLVASFPGAEPRSQRRLDSDGQPDESVQGSTLLAQANKLAR